MAFDQLEKPQSGDRVAVIHTTMGDFRVRLFPDRTPKTCENFMTHAQNGYYDGIVFHRVIRDFIIQGGDPTATGCGGESIWKRSFEDEFHPDLHNLNGALCMANAGPNTNGSQFFIVQAKTVDPSLIAQMEQLPNLFSPECIQAYREVGGTPWLDYHHTVFGQVYEGMDVVDAIAGVQTDGSDRPLQDVAITGIEIQTV